MDTWVVILSLVMNYLILFLGVVSVLGSIPEVIRYRKRVHLLLQKGRRVSWKNLLADFSHPIFGICLILAWFTVFRSLGIGWKFGTVVLTYSLIQLFYWKYSTVSLLLDRKGGSGRNQTL